MTGSRRAALALITAMFEGRQADTWTVAMDIVDEFVRSRPNRAEGYMLMFAAMSDLASFAIDDLRQESKLPLESILEALMFRLEGVQV